MSSKDEVNPRNIPFPLSIPQETTADDSNKFSKQLKPVKNAPESDSCQCCCCRFLKFMGSAVKSLQDRSISNDAEYKPYFELETEEEKLSYEYFNLLACVTYDEIVEKHREQALEELHQYRLGLLLEELRLMEETDIFYSSSNECFSQFGIKIPKKRRSLRINNKKRRFQRQKFRK